MDFKNINSTQIMLVLVLIAFIWYISYTTTPIPISELNENVTANYNTQEYIVLNYITNEMVGIGVILVLALFLSTKIKDIKQTRITEREFKKMISREIKKKQNEPLPDGKYEIPKGEIVMYPNILLRYKTENKITQPFKYIAQITIEDVNGKEHYYLVTGNPNTAFIDDFVETDERLTIIDKCPNCGRFPDEKIILPDELRALKEFKQLIQ